MHDEKENPHKGGQQSDCASHSTTSKTENSRRSTVGVVRPSQPAELPDFEQATGFLTLLDETAKRWTFQTFDDNKSRDDKKLARILHGTLTEC